MATARTPTVQKKLKKTAGKSAVRVLRAEPLERLPWLVHGFSTRTGGGSQSYGCKDDLNLGFTKEDTRAAVEKNRARFVAALGLGGKKSWPLVTLKQVHSDVIHRVEKVSKSALSGDGLITNVPEILLAIQTADCLPILLIDPEHRAVGAFHAGWRGTLARIVEKGVGRMQAKFGSKPKDIVAAIGPGIHKCCYEVEESFRDTFASQFAYSNDLFDEVFDSNA